MKKKKSATAKFKPGGYVGPTVDCCAPERVIPPAFLKPREVRSNTGSLENLSDALAAFGYALHSITHKFKPMNQQQTGCGTETDRELFSVKFQLEQETEWADKLDTMVHETLERITVVTNRNNQLSASLAEEKRRTNWMQTKLDALEKQFKEAIDEKDNNRRQLIASEEIRKAGEARILDLNKKLKAKKLPAKKARKR